MTDELVRVIRIPRSVVRRDAMSFAKLLSKVSPNASTGFEFEGTFLRPGARIDHAALWPTPQHPRVPVLLECAGSDGTGWGHRRSPLIYILWRYDQDQGEWIELARAVGQAWDWCEVLGPVAARALAEQLPVRPPPDVGALAQRMARLLDDELGAVAPEERWKLLAIIHDQLAWRFTAAA